MIRNIVLVDSADTQLGLMDIWDAHKNPGVLHRAVSVILFNSKEEILLQKRSAKKPLWPDFWSNTFCTHPYDGESYLDCAVRRAKEELGINLAQSLFQIAYRFEYQADYNQELSEHELDTVIIGKYEGEVLPNSDEASESVWISLEKIINVLNNSKQSINYNLTTITSDQLTPWFKLILNDKRFLEVTRNIMRS